MAKILVMDDEADLLEMMRVVLEQRAGHQVVLSAEAPDGLAKALADPPDLAIVDVMMPHMTGYEVCRRLRANPATASIPILIITARAQPMDREAALSAGADDYMTKPVLMHELLERVENLLAKSTTRGSGPLVFFSLRGGVGVTTLAVNLAALLARGREQVIALLDLCTSGHVALQLGLRPESHWAGLMADAQAGRPPDPGTIKGHLLIHNTGLRVLASPVVPPRNPGWSPQTMEALLDGLPADFSSVVVDAPSVLDEAMWMLLERAAIIGLVVTPEPAAVQTTVGTLRALSPWAEKCRVILNQVSPGALPPREAIERALKQPLAAVIPFDPAQSRAVVQHIPLVVGQPDSPLAQGVLELARALGFRV